MDIVEVARRYAVKNAIDYGQAMPGPIVSKLMALRQGSIEEASKVANEAAAWANAMSKDDLKSEYAKYAEGFAVEKKEKEEKTAKPKMELPGAVKGSFVTRFPPEPNGYMHIGHAKAVILEQEFKRIYGGKLLLYWDDSNPEKEKQEFLDSIKRDLDWLGIEFDREVYASDNMEKVYSYAKILIEKGKAYACSCNSERMREMRMKGGECEHRNTGINENLKVFEQMMEGELEEGEVVIRFKGEMKSDNTTLRDPTLMRVKKSKHYRQGSKYSLWPLYDLNTPINDYLNGVTDVIRDKNYELRDALYLMILDALGLKRPRIHSEARLVINDNVTSKRELNILIEEEKISGPDDPRLITIAGLRRRGIRPEAIREFIMRFGMSRSESHIDISMLLDENKKLVDPTAKRLYFVDNPAKVLIEGLEAKSIELKLHPSANLGSRSYRTDGVFYVSGTDAKAMPMGAIFKLKGFTEGFRVDHFEDSSMMCKIVDEDAKLKAQWVTDRNKIPCQVIMPRPPLKKDGEFDNESLTVVKGFIEDYALKLKEGEMVQLERFGFCILDDKKAMSFIFMSK